jgi:hypothetical protein
LQAVGVVVVYVDLWADARRDPGGLIAEAIARALAPQLGLVARTARKAGLEKVKVGGLEVDTSKIGKVDGLTLTDALRLLHESAGKPVALIIDEAQHALTSEAGEAAMTALKSARDQLNQPGVVNLMLVMSGSDRDKLLRLVNTAGAPFYGSQIQRMPPLGPDFIAHIAALIEAQRPELRPVDQALLQQAFEVFGHRPQFFMAALGQVLSPLAALSGRFEVALLEAAQQQQAQDEAQMDADYLGSSPPSRPCCGACWSKARASAPTTPRRCASTATRPPIPERTQAQRALEALRQRMPALVWKSARGEYALEDAAMHRWFEKRSHAGLWPPTPPQGLLALDDD